MKPVDLNIRAQTEQELQSCLYMAELLGYSALVSTLGNNITHNQESPVQLYRRHDLSSNRLSKLKTQISKLHGKYHIISIPLHDIDTANWAAEDNRVHLLTVDTMGKSVLRKTTAGICSEHGTALEIPIVSLLEYTGLDRSRIIKILRDAVATAIGANMKVVLSSGAITPLRMRSPVALFHIGMTLGLDMNQAKEAILVNPSTILNEVLKTQDGTIVRKGIEIVKGGEGYETE